MTLEMFEMTDEQFDLIVDHLAKRAQRENRARGYLVVRWFPGAVIVNGTKCTTLAEVVEVTSAVTAAMRAISPWLPRSPARRAGARRRSK